jgi:hypothetical protein
MTTRDLRIKHMPHVRVEGAGLKDVCFSHEHPDIGTVNITRLLKGIATGKVYARTLYLDFAKDSVDRIEIERDIDPKVMAFLEANYEKAGEPILGVAMTDGSIVIIDGSHRSALWGRKGIYTMPVTLVSVTALPGYQVKTFIDGVEQRLDKAMIEKGYEFNRKQESKTCK